MSEYTSKPRPDDPEIPEYQWIPGMPDPKNHNTVNGCYGCDFSKSNIRCSLIPCQRHPGMVAKIINKL